MFRRIEPILWQLIWGGLLVLAIWFGAIAVSNAYADHDGNDEPWRQPLLIACLPNWDYGSTRVVVHAPGYPQHGRTLHDQPFAVRDIFYKTWFRDTEDARAVDAHLIQWRREYECTHPPALVTVGGQLPKGGGREVRVGDGPTPPPDYPTPSPTPEPTAPPTQAPVVAPAVVCPPHDGTNYATLWHRGEAHHHPSLDVTHSHQCDAVFGETIETVAG